MPDQDPSIPKVPESRVEVGKRRRISMVWVIPIVAALAGGWIAATRILGAGPTITIILKTAEGIEAGKTKVRYNGVDVGTLTKVVLSQDRQNVVATVQMAPKSEHGLVEDTQFWVVRPRISGATVTGLGTLISGAYFGVELGHSKVAKREFVALATEPVVASGVAGRIFVLKTADLGSIDNGTPVYYRRLQVGQVISYVLDKDGSALTVEVFVNAPYDRFVNKDTRFWQASGLDFSVSADGLKVQTASLLSILVGGIGFDSPLSAQVQPEAEARQAFSLFNDRATAFDVPVVNPQTFVLDFKESVRGLALGAPVEFQGITIGTVSGIHAQMDATTEEFSIPVTIEINSTNLGIAILNLKPGEDEHVALRRILDSLVARGLRAQLKTANLLTGSLIVTLDFVPNAPEATVDWTQKPMRFPTAPGTLVALEDSINRILNKLESMPIEAIIDDVRRVIAQLDQTITSAHRTVDNVDDLVVKKLGAVPFASIGDEIRKIIADLDKTVLSARSAVENVDAITKPDSALSGELTGTLQEIARAARNLGVLLDYLERHPEALLRGKAGESK